MDYMLMGMCFVFHDICQMDVNLKNLIISERM